MTPNKSKGNEVVPLIDRWVNRKICVNCRNVRDGECLVGYYVWTPEYAKYCSEDNTIKECYLFWDERKKEQGENNGVEDYLKRGRFE